MTITNPQVGRSTLDSIQRLAKVSAHPYFLWKCHLKMSNDANNLNPDPERLCLHELLFVHIREISS